MATYETHQGPGPQVLSASTITGDEVRNPEGDDLGKIEEVMLDMGSGRISYAVLSFGGVMGLGDKLFAIPWSALELDPDNRCFVLDVEKEKLENAPGFAKDNWPSFADNTWATQIHSYYGSRPYWEI